MTDTVVKNRARRIIERFKTMQTEKAMWNTLYQLCGEYVMTRKQNFVGKKTPGDLMVHHLYDDTAPSANSTLSASLIGSLWPNGAKSFQIVAPSGLEKEDLGDEPEAVKQYYEFVTRRMTEFMDNPKSGFRTALEEYMLDQGAFGISGIMVEDNEDSTEVPLAYRAVDAKVLFIDEGKNGFVDTIYMMREFNVRQLVGEYGLENVSKKWKEAFLQNDTKSKAQVLHAIEPRRDRDPFGFGKNNMPFSSIHIDLETEKIMRESGFIELPVSVTRFWKAMGEKYGRSPAMNALPSILEANSLGEAYILAVEKTLDPALLVLDDGTLGSGEINTSPGAITVLSVSGRIGAQALPVQPLVTVGSLEWTAARRTELTEIIKNHFFLDRLMDLNNEQRMTAFETNIRNGLRGQTLNPVYSRQYAELFVPTLETTFNKLRRRGLLGIPNPQELPEGSDLQLEAIAQEAEIVANGGVPVYIPAPVLRRILKGENVYKIEFISPASRIMQTEELVGIEHLVATVTNTAQVQPSTLENIDWDWTIRRVQELDGSPRETVVSLERLKKLRDDRRAAEQSLQELQQRREESEIARNNAQAAAASNGINAAGTPAQGGQVA